MIGCSLLSRFQGLLVGSTIPETIFDEQVKKTMTVADWEPMNQEIVSSLINLGKVELPENLYGNLTIDGPSQVALVSLPIVLFFHDLPETLAQQVLKLASAFKLSPEEKEDVLAYSRALTLVLTKKLSPETILPQLLEKISEPAFAQKIELIEQYSLKGGNLEQIVNKLNSNDRKYSMAIPVAIYLFSLTPKDFHLCLKRTFQLTNTYERFQSVCMLTGAILGAYNGYINIPWSWRNIDQNQLLGQKKQQAELLLAAFAGVISPERKKLSLTTTVAQSPSIQVRSSLKIISQG